MEDKIRTGLRLRIGAALTLLKPKGQIMVLLSEGKYPDSDYDDQKWPYGEDCDLFLSPTDRLQEALEWYEKFLTIYPQDATAWNNWGLALSLLGRYQEAIERYDKALAIDPKFSIARYNRGEALKGRRSGG